MLLHLCVTLALTLCQHAQLFLYALDTPGYLFFIVLALVLILPIHIAFAALTPFPWR